MPLRRHHILPLLLMCLCEPCLYFLFEAAALQLTSASQASMITAMLPLLVGLAAAAYLGERITVKTLIGFFFAATGALWLSLAGDRSPQAPQPLLGNLLEFLAMICATGYTILMKYLSRDLNPFLLTGMQAVVGALFFLPVIFLPQVPIPSALPAEGVAVILYLGTLVSVGAYGCYNFGISRIPASQASAFVNLIPVFAVILGYLLLGERLTPWQIVASCLVFGGVLYSQDRVAEKRPVLSPQ
jgi:drug/metabolite transporter (DMT)-like permease